MGSTLQSFEELDCYKVCRALRMAISLETKQWPVEEKRRLVDQIIRSSRSVTANIAEGFGRHYHTENIQFCRQARGSLTETLEHLITASDEGFLPESRLAIFRPKVAECLRLLNGYINYLSRIPPR